MKAIVIRLDAWDYLESSVICHLAYPHAGDYGADKSRKMIGMSNLNQGLSI